MDYINMDKLTLDELVGVVNLYPWFGGARKELCARMSRLGDGCGEAQFADAAMYIGARRKLADMMRVSRKEDWTDADMERLLRSYIAEKELIEEAASTEAVHDEKRKVYAGVGDYFSQADYDNVRKDSDNVFSHYAAKARQGMSEQDATAGIGVDMYTETLAQIYAEQGYYEQAKHIYSKLILEYPEKNAYFAALIEKLEKINS